MMKTLQCVEIIAGVLARDGDICGYELGVREGAMAGPDVPSHPKGESGKL